MIYTWKISEETINRVKELIPVAGIRGSARQSGVSFYTAWCISQGRYDNSEPLHGKLMEGRCPITGFKMSQKLSMGKKSLI
jgi:hypothetical protein